MVKIEIMKILCKYLFIIVLLNVSIFGSPAIKICSIGSAVDAGSYRLGLSGVVFEGKGRGLKENRDGFLFAYSNVAGNCDLEISLSSFNDTMKIAEAGIMIRTDTTENSAFCALVLLNEKGTFLKYRSSSGQNVRTVFISNEIYSKLRIKRQDTTYSFYYKTNLSSTWTGLTTNYNFTFPGTLCAGMFHTSNDSTYKSESQFNYINGIPEIITDTACTPVIIDFSSSIPLDSLGFTSINNWKLDTISKTIVTTLNRDSTGIAYVNTPKLESEIGNDTLELSWDLLIKGDTIPPLNDYSLYSIEKMEFSDRVKINGLRIGSSAKIDMGVNDTINSDVYSGGNVVIKDRSTVWGKVIAAGVCTLGTGAYVSGSISENTDLSFPVIPTRIVTTGSTNKIIAPYDSVNLTPGIYDTLRAGAYSKIRFIPGNYSFSTFDIQPEVRLYMDTDSSRRIDINVSGKVLLSDRMKMVMRRNDIYGNISIYTNSTDTVKFGADLTLFGSFYTPNAVSHLISRNVVIRGGIYAKKIKIEPDVSIIATTQASGENRFITSFIPVNPEEPIYHLTFLFHRGMERDSIKDFVLQRNIDTIFSSSTCEKTPLNRNLNFKQLIFQAASGFALQFIYDNGLGEKMIFDSVPFAITNLDYLKFTYYQGSTLRQNYLHIDNISTSCIDDTCPPFVLMKNPSDTTVIEGGTATFSCSVKTGPSVPVYQWFRNEIPIPMTNSPIYIIRNAGISDDGAQYRCHISNVCGKEINTAMATLNVLQCKNPVILSNPVSDTVKLGLDVNFSVTAIGDGLKYQWKRNDRIIPGATSSSYSIDTVKAHHNMDRYCVIIKNGCGKETISDCAILVVSDINPCKIIKHPNNDTLFVNDYYRTGVQTICEDGNYIWYRNNLPISGSFGQTLIYGPLTMEDDGAEFFCIINNGVTSDTSNISKIVVRPPLDNLSSVSISGELFDGDNKIQGLGDSCFYDFRVDMFTVKSGGAVLYSETQKNVIVRDGQFTITLGRGSFTGNLQHVTSSHKELYAELYAGEKGTMRIIAPRLRLTAVPYAFSSGIKIINGSGNPNTTSPEAPFGTLYIDKADSNKTWKLGKKGWVKLD